MKYFLPSYITTLGSLAFNYVLRYSMFIGLPKRKYFGDEESEDDSSITSKSQDSVSCSTDDQMECITFFGHVYFLKRIIELYLFSSQNDAWDEKHYQKETANNLHDLGATASTGNNPVKKKKLEQTPRGT